MPHPVAPIGRRHGVAVVAVVAVAALLAAGCGSSGSENRSSAVSTEPAASATSTSLSSDTAETSSTTDDSTTDDPEGGDAGATTGPAGDTDLPNLAMGGRTLQEGAYSLELNGAGLEVEIDESTAGLQLEGLNPDTLAVTSDSTYFAIGSVMGLVPAELAAGEMAGPPPADQLAAFGTPDEVADHLDTLPGIAVVGEGERTLAGEPLFSWDIELDPDRPDGSTATCPRFVPRGSECVLVVAAEDWGGFVTEVDRLRLYWSPNLEIGGIAEAQQEGFDEWMEAVNGLLDGISAAQV
ncbi:MAG: hypothetical protein OES24_01970 [Acidimicrobiia bacterium]|nr:hypothetical protein [Acidimicrobiia bacterium]